jgi:hypothetical protein
MSNEVKFGADAKDYFTVTKSMQAELDKLSQKVGGFGRTSQRAGRESSEFARVAGTIIGKTTGASGAYREVSELNRLVGSTTAIAAVAGFALAEAYSRASDKATEFRESIEKIKQPTGPGAFLGTEEIDKTITDATAKLDEFQKRDARENSGPAGAIVKAARYAQGVALGEGTPATQAAQEATDKTDLRKVAAESISKLAEKTNLLNDAEEKRLRGSERQADLDKAQIAINEKLGKLAAQEAAAHVTNPDAREALVRAHELETAAIDKKHDALERELTLKEALVRLGEGFVSEQSGGSVAGGLDVSAQKSVLGAGQRNLASLLLRKQSAEAALNDPNLSDNERRERELERDTTGDELDRAAYAESQKPIAQRHQEQRDEQRFQNWRDQYARNQGLTNIHRDANGNIIGGTDAAGRAVHPSVADPLDALKSLHGKRYNVLDFVKESQAQAKAKQSIEKPMTKREFDEVMAKYWGGS